jgi:hypothetical protein
VINVNSTQYNSPAGSFAVRDQSSITGGVVNTSETIEHIGFTFSSWSPGGSTSAAQQFTPSDNTTYTANFSAKPEAPTNVQAGGNVNENVHVTWTDNANSNVGSYQISRRLKDEPSPTHVATVSSGVQTWTDSAYIVTGTESDHFVEYYVYAVYTPTGSLSDAGTSVVWASESMGIPLKPVVNAGDIPSKFSLGNYPNPFNPSTTIRYDLPKDAGVKMDIYDVMGRKVRTLMDGSRSAGSYSVVWNSRDDHGRDVASGVYLYRFVASPTNGDKPFTQSGKLVLTR